MLAPRSDFLHEHRGLQDQLDTPDHQHVIVDRADWEHAMSLLFGERRYVVSLSQRNLLTLLGRLQREGCNRCITKPTGNIIFAEPDVEHYGGRQPGPMRPADEHFIADMEAFMECRKGHATATLRKSADGTLSVELVSSDNKSAFLVVDGAKIIETSDLCLQS